MMLRLDDAWHHIAVSWEFETGRTTLLFDGAPVVPFWGRTSGQSQFKHPSDGGVPPIMAPMTYRYVKQLKSRHSGNECKAHAS